MPNTKFYYTDGNVKMDMEFSQYRDSSWNWITGAPESKDDDLYSRVAAVFRAVNLTADAMASMPFALVNIASGEDYDTSENWENKVGFMPNPSELLRLWRMSLFMTNSAYAFMEGNRVIKNLRYIVPGTITPIVNSQDGLLGFKRTVGTTTTEYSLKDRRIFWMWRRDHTTELLPSKYTEFMACMAAAGILYLADYYIQNFFQRGGIKPSMLMVKGVPNPQEREKIESIWEKVIHGWSKYLGKVFNADAMEVQTIGEGIENLKDSTLHEERLADIAMAAGMPLSLLVANSANYATARTEYTSWFRNSVVPWSGFMADGLNDVLFTPMGLRFEFRYEMSEEGQEEEVKRSIAYARYVQTGMLPSIAAQIVGIDLPGDMEYEDLDPDEEEVEPTTDAEPERGIVQPEPGEEEPEEEKSAKFSADQPRVPAGSSEGGQWMDEEGGGGGDYVSAGDKLIDSGGYMEKDFITVNELKPIIRDAGKMYYSASGYPDKQVQITASVVGDDIDRFSIRKDLYVDYGWSSKSKLHVMKPSDEFAPSFKRAYRSSGRGSIRFTPSLKQMQEINLWHDLARRKMKRGEAMDFQFTSTLPMELHDGIAAKLSLAICNEQVDEAFTLDTEPEYKTESEIFALVAALNKAVEVIA